jgi:hypothetical protein
MISALAVSTATLVQKASGSPLAIDQTPRAIGSVSPAERNSLPDGTMVKLDSGRVVSLGILRAEHRARMERFSRAAALGQATAARLAAHPSNPVPVNPPTNATVPSKPGQTVKGGASKPEVMRANTSVGPKLDALSSGFVRFRMPSFGEFVPKDYADFCKAANPSVCIYFPASATLTLAGTRDFVVKGWVMDEDPLITDMAICKYDGGVFTGSKGSSFGPGVCQFFYPVDNTAMFMPSGPISSSESCDPPAKSVLDPKGAVKVWYPYSGDGFTTGGAPVTCVVQVWVGK